MKAFEEKCTRLYDTRLKEYVYQSEEMISQYETQLLQVIESGLNLYPLIVHFNVGREYASR